MKFLAPLSTLALSYVLFFGYLIGSYDSLPQHVASHFDFQGQPDGWMSRNDLVGFTVGLGIFMPAVLVGLMASAGRIPVHLVNLPNRDYWLAPERRKETSSVLLYYALWFASMNVLFVTGVHWLVVQANKAGGSQHLDETGIVIVLGGFLLGSGLWIGLLKRQFSVED